MYGSKTGPNQSNAAGTGPTQLHFCRQASPDAEVPFTSAGKPRPTQKYHLCRQASPDAEVIGARLPRTKQTLPATMPDAARDQNLCRHRSPTQKTTKRYVDQIDK